MEIVTIEQLIEENKFEQALSEIALLKEDETLAGMLLEGEILQIKGDYDKGLELANKVLEQTQDQDLVFKAKVLQSAIYIEFDDLNAGLLHSFEVEKLYETLNSEDKQKCKVAFAKLLILIGVYLDYKGDLDPALKYYKESLEVRNEIGNKSDIAASINNIGEIYRNKGELDLALEYYRRSHQLYSELGRDDKIAFTIHNIGIINYQKGDFEIAHHYLGQSLKLFRDTYNLLETAETLFYLVLTSIYLNNENEAEEHYNGLQKIRSLGSNQFVNLFTELSEAMILKSKNRLKDKADAQRLLEKIVAEDIINHEMTVFSLLNLCDLLLYELKITGQPEILNELRDYATRLLSIAEDQGSSSLIAEAYLIQSRISLLELDIEKARMLLSRAQSISQVKGLNRLAILISNEHDQLLESIDRWENLIASNSSLVDRIELAEFEDMILKLIRKRVDESEIEKEEPVLFLILDEAGNSRYTKKFDSKYDLNEGLIGILITAINSFSKDAFSSSAPIERIKHHEFTIIIKKMDRFLFCYIFKGQSYSAIQKIDLITEEIKQDEHLSGLITERRRRTIPSDHIEINQLIESHILRN